MTELQQPGFDPRLEWAAEGAAALAGVCPVLVVVDVLRFTTAVEVAVARGAEVTPRPWPGRAAPAATGGEAAPLPAPGTGTAPGPYSLSPLSLLGIPPGTRLALASPNGATVSLAAAWAGADGHWDTTVQRGTASTSAGPASVGAVVLGGCLRNASAVAAAASGLGGPVGVVAAGERRPDGSLRPAVEDLVGAGAILRALGGRPSPEARAAAAAFLDAADALPATLAGCVSGRELTARGCAADLPLAAEHDVSRVVPVLRDGAFAQLSWPG